MILSFRLLPALALLALLAAPGASAREPGKLDDIKRETRIVADVMRAALRDQLRGDVRLTRLEAEYLPQQGVLVSVNLNNPWLVINRQGDPEFEFHGDITIPEIPAMVENILHDLQINVTPYEAEDLEALRDLRTEQRDLRLEARELRAKLRERRRSLVRANDHDERHEIEQEIVELEEELATVDGQYEGMSAEIEAHYEALRSYDATVAAVTPPEPPTPPGPPRQKLGLVIANTACDYGGTLKSLSSDDYLTVVLRRGKSSQYYAFRMEHIYQCGRRNMSPERALELAYQYED